MFERRFALVLIVIGFFALSASAQKTNDPADEQTKEFKKALNSLVKMIDTGFKNARGEEMPKGNDNIHRRFKTSITLPQAESCEISLPNSARPDSSQAQYIAHYPQVTASTGRKMYEKLVEAVTQALGPNFYPYHSQEVEKYTFSRKGETQNLVTVSYETEQQSRLGPITAKVVLTVGYSYF